MKAKSAPDPEQFIEAISGNKLSTVKSLLKKHPELVNITTPSQQHPLMVAAKLNRHSIMKEMLATLVVDSKTVNALKSSEGYTLLEVAGFGFCDVIKAKGYNQRRFKAYCATLANLSDYGCTHKASGK